VASSAGSDSDEAVQLVKPTDGVYRVAVDNFSGPAGTFDLEIFALQGTGLSVSGVPAGALPAATEVELTVSFNQFLELGETYEGIIFVGPTEAPEVVQIHVEVTRVGYRQWLVVIYK
jgi:hypothetical protein